jgi:hypothetical protein
MRSAWGIRASRYKFPRGQNTSLQWWGDEGWVGRDPLLEAAPAAPRFRRYLCICVRQWYVSVGRGMDIGYVSDLAHSDYYCDRLLLASLESRYCFYRFIEPLLSSPSAFPCISSYLYLTLVWLVYAMWQSPFVLPVPVTQFLLWCFCSTNCLWKWRALFIASIFHINFLFSGKNVCSEIRYVVFMNVFESRYCCLRHRPHVSCEQSHIVNVRTGGNL